MEKLLKYLILTIRIFWDQIAVIQNDISIRYIDIFKEAYNLSNIFNTLNQKKSTKKLKIAICTNNSIEWIISFLSIIISNNTLIIISPSLGLKKILHILSITKTDFLISDINDYDFRYRFSGIIISTESTRSEDAKYLKIFKIFREIITNHYFKKSGDELIIYTPNRLEEIKISFDKIYVLLRELKNKEIFKSKTDYLAYPEFSYNYVLCMLLPLISNTTIIIPNQECSLYNLQNYIEKIKPPTLIITSNQFQKLFSEYINIPTFKIIEYFREILSLIRLRIPLKQLIIKKRLNKLFPNIEKLIILNSSISFNMEKFLKKIKFPYTITYGTIETYGIATYSHPSEHEIESVGKGIINNITIVNNIICDISRGICRYGGFDYYSLSDLGIKDKNGNIYYICRTYNYSVNSWKLEDILMYIPFVLECTLQESEVPKELPYLLVNIDFDQAEAKGITNIEEIHDIIDSYIKRLSLPISRVIIWKSKFQRDTYGRIVNVQL